MTNRIRVTLISISTVLLLYVALGGLIGKSESTSEKTYRDLGVYSEVLNRINLDYVPNLTSRRSLTGRFGACLQPSIPTALTFPGRILQEFLKHPEPRPADVGIFLSKRMGYATVVAVLPGSPAEKAGVGAGTSSCGCLVDAGAFRGAN